MRDGAGLTDQVHLLLRDGIAHLLPFALVSVEGGRVHAIVRGGVEVDVRTADGLRVISAARVSTWTEDSVADALTVAVRSTGREVDESAALPVLSAVVRAGAVRVELAAAPTGGTGSAPARRARAVVPDAPRTGPRPVADGPAPAPRPVPDETATAPVVPAAPVPAAPVPAPSASAAPVPAHPVPALPVPAAPVPAPSPAPLPVPSPAVPALVPDDVPADVVDGVPAEDHDGTTVLSSDVVALRRQLPDWAGDAVPGPLAVPAPRTPPPAKLLLSSGLVVSLNRPVLLGRAPQVSRVANREIPRLVTVASPNQDISRTHAEIRMEGEEVVVTDLRSTNGVLLLRQGVGPQRLHPGEPTVVEPGVVVDLGEGVTFTVERGV